MAKTSAGAGLLRPRRSATDGAKPTEVVVFRLAPRTPTAPWRQRPEIPPAGDLEGDADKTTIAHAIPTRPSAMQMTVIGSSTFESDNFPL